MLNVFIGYDPRQPVAYNVLQHSIVRHASEPVAITPLILKQLPIERRGLTEFTFSRFLVPYLCGFKGMAVFLDADMVVTLSPFKANLDISDVLLPIAPFTETSGSFVNAEGRLQSFHAVVRPLGDTLYWMPPYCITPDELEFLFNATLRAVEEACR